MQETTENFCFQCNGTTHMPWCSEYEEPSRGQSASATGLRYSCSHPGRHQTEAYIPCQDCTAAEQPVSDREKTERFVRATGQPTVMQALAWIEQKRRQYPDPILTREEADLVVGAIPLLTSETGKETWKYREGSGVIYAETVPVKIIARYVDANNAGRIINNHNHCGEQLRFLGDRLEAQAQQMADLAGENEQLRAMIKRYVDYYSGNNAARLGNGQARRSLDEFRSALNHATRGEENAK